MLQKLTASLVCLALLAGNCPPLYAQEFSIASLPVPGTMVGPSLPFEPLALKGIVVNPQKPLELQFIVDTGKENSKNSAAVKEEADRLVKYFMTGLTIPEKDLWVNLSPYEKDRIIPEALGQTELGREFWARVYKKAQEKFGTTTVPVNTFNKVWILPNQAQVFENGNAAYVTKATLKVMLDEDYQAKQKHSATGAASISSQIVREIIIPEIEKEVNQGKNFAPLRQIYQALILAKWYKETVKNALFEAVYLNKNKIAGVDLTDTTLIKQIYDRYVQAYKKGVFNFVKEEASARGQVFPKKYFSGGANMQLERVDQAGSEKDVRTDYAMSIFARIKESLAPSVSLESAMDTALVKLAKVPELNQTPTLENVQPNPNLLYILEVVRNFNDSVSRFRAKFKTNPHLIMRLQAELVKRGYYFWYYSESEEPVLLEIEGVRHMATRDGHVKIPFLLVKPADKEQIRQLPHLFFQSLYLPLYPTPLSIVYMPHIREQLPEIMSIKKQIDENRLNLVNSKDIEHPSQYTPYFRAEFWKDPQNSDILNSSDPEKEVMEKLINIKMVQLMEIYLLHYFQPIQLSPELSNLFNANYNNKMAILVAVGLLKSALVEKIFLIVPEMIRTRDFLSNSLFNRLIMGPNVLKTLEEWTTLPKGDLRQKLEELYGDVLWARPQLSQILTQPISLNQIASNLNAFAESRATAAASKAMIGIDSKSSVEGGIDLKQIQLNKQGRKVVVHFDSAQLSGFLQDGFNGFQTEILNIRSIQSPLPLLGISPRKEDGFLAAKV